MHIFFNATISARGLLLGRIFKLFLEVDSNLERVGILFLLFLFIALFTEIPVDRMLLLYFGNSFTRHLSTPAYSHIEAR